MLRQNHSLARIVVLVFALAGSQVAVAEGDSGRRLVGTWIVDINSPMLPPATDITVVNRDGTLSNSDSLLGTGHGIWRQLGNSTFEMKFITPVLAVLNTTGTAFFPGVTLTITTKDLTLEQGGMAASGTFEADLEPDQPNFPDFEGEIRFTRMTFND